MDHTFTHLLDRLVPCYPEREARAIARLVLETRFGFTWTELCMGKDKPLPEEQRANLENIVERLLRKEPVQYVLGKADFLGQTFSVGPGVLIPRPETEELVAWAVAEHRDAPKAGLRALDIGTGSGCIAVALAAALPGAHVSAIDISTAALATARRNAEALHADIDFRQADILAEAEAPQAADRWDLIVSNPPYVCEREKKDMDTNVLAHEPGLALFVPDDDPLRFYRAIGTYAARTLREGGKLYVEINRAYGEATAELLAGLGLRHATLRKDLWGNNRMIRCEK